MTAVHTTDYLAETGEVWSADKAKAYKDVFLEFLNYCVIPSKERGVITLGGQLYPAQERGLDAIFSGLCRGIHDFKWGKGRQQGISTICRPFSTMWIAMHPGSRGAFLLDTAQHMAEARTEIEFTLANLPAKLKFPSFTSNRYGGRFANGSTVTFLSAGVKQTAGGGALGRGQGITMTHASEAGTYNNPEGISSFRKSLAVENPDRLFLWESTGRNVGSDWHQMWTKAKANDLEEATIFTGWYLVPTHRIRKGTPQFERFGSPEITRDEQRRIQEVKDRYGWEITREQLAWYRKETNPFAYAGEEEEVEENEIAYDEYQSREHPWVEEEMFTTDGSNFFSSERLTDVNKTTVSDEYKSWTYYCGAQFLDMSIEPARTRRDTMLKVWEEPKVEGVYVVAADPAFGANEHNDRSCVQVMRCYADKLEQVAEFASPTVQPHQFAWVIASLMGWYQNTRLILEINGPGSAVLHEYGSLKKSITTGYMAKQAEEQGLRNFFANCKAYLYSRPDALVPGQGSIMWKCLDVNTPIPTPSGWSTMGQLKVGDRVFDDQGQPCRVTGLSPVHENHDCFRVVFDDGAVLVADADHLWEVRERVTSKRRDEKRVVRTIDLKPGRHKIAVTGELELPEADLPIDPYLLGVWLGDGYSASGRVCGSEADLREIVKHTGQKDASIYQTGKGLWVANFPGLIGTLRQQGLLNNKHIPVAYLRASRSQRLALLQGLMDTDGTYSKSAGHCEFTTSKPVLATGFLELLRTFGIKGRFLTRNREIAYNGGVSRGATAYQFNFVHYDSPVFRLARKVTAVRVPEAPQPGKYARRSIVAVTPVASVPVQCISVDSPSHLFLAGDAMVPTHNTTGPNKVGLMERLRDFLTNGGLIVRSRDAIEEMRSITRDGDSIKAEGSDHDDRVLALAFAILCWEQHERRKLINANRTYKIERARASMTLGDQYQLLSKHQLNRYFKSKEAGRRAMELEAKRLAWRGR